MKRAKLIGTGIAVPERVLTNDELSRILGEDINDFVLNTLGISERRILNENESVSDIASEASKNALENAGLDATELDLIILATDTPEYISPATSVVVQHRIGAVNAGTFDVNCACAGFVTAFDMACKYIAADSKYRNVLVIGAYAMSKFVDWKEKKTATIFADGAGAVILQAAEEDVGLLASRLRADGSYHDFLGVFAGGTKYPIDEKELREGYRTKVRFAKKYPPEVNIVGWQEIVAEVLNDACLTKDMIKLFLWTQVNLSTIKTVMSEMNLPMERTHTVMQKWGYTGSACIPMALHDAIQAGKIVRGDNILMCASGGGLNMAAVVFRF
ncbi:MAG: ketoacyl-ACP synthase III [Pyrinomonadaceae bacterium]|nr:ketoacyl-ACP synthase III [Pyrinomonadaceae bacterium]MCX7640022.1 ketoacyl-ACP synthase III [Pyrinomonadaceae bacterium]MDW8304194.1 ketoacyl-ACP synthase III [Acidobacteriota bacterium]